jgi:hypothetical protein
MVWIPLLQAHVKSGDFLLAYVREEAAPSICRIIDVASENELRVTWWWKAEELLSFVGLEALPPLSGVVFTTLNLTQRPLVNPNERVIIAMHIIPGTFFVRLGELFQVVSVDGNEVVISDDYGEHLTIEPAEASQLLKDCLG